MCSSENEYVDQIGLISSAHLWQHNCTVVPTSAYSCDKTLDYFTQYGRWSNNWFQISWTASLGRTVKSSIQGEKS